MSEARSLWAGVRKSRVLLIVSIATLVAAVLWLVFIFPTVWESFVRFAVAPSEGAAWPAFEDYALKVVTLWLVPILVGGLAALFLVLRVLIKPHEPR